jgi:hypothetical protein
VLYEIIFYVRNATLNMNNNKKSGKKKKKGNQEGEETRCKTIR